MFYDFNDPVNVPDYLLGACAGIVLDPPYLNAPCLRGFTSTALAIAARFVHSSLINILMAHVH